MSTVLVIGAGPSGLATTASLKRKGIAVDLVDRRGVAGGAYQHIYSKLVMASPTRYTQLPGYGIETAGEYVTVSEYRQYLTGYAAHHELSVRKATVERIDRTVSHFRVQFAGDPKAHEFAAVVVATGMYDFPRWPAVQGLDLHSTAGLKVMHSSQWIGPEALHGHRVLIVGGATSAIEIAEECARAGLNPVMSVRGKKVNIFPQRFLGRDIHDYVTGLLARLPRAFMKSYCQGRQSLPGLDIGFRRFRDQGVITVRGALARVSGNTMVFDDESRGEFDVLVAATGYRFDVPFLPPAVVRSASSGPPLADGCQSRSWPGLYVVGMPCVRRLNSEFLYGIASDAQVVADRIAGQHRKRAA